MRRTAEVIYEELLALRCRRGEKAALEELVQTWEKRLFYFIRRLVDNEADAWDVLQQTWVRVLSGIGALREPRSLGPWLYRVARHPYPRHAAIRRLRQARPDLRPPPPRRRPLPPRPARSDSKRDAQADGLSLTRRSFPSPNNEASPRFALTVAPIH